jgi:membrane protease YdiL (CAAX protease family)
LPPRHRTTTTPAEALAVTATCFGLFIFGSVNAVASGFPSGAFSDGALLSLVVIELVLGIGVLGFLHLRGYAVATLFPAPSLRASLAGIGLFFGAWLIGWFIVAPFAAGQAEQPIHRMVLDAHLSLPVIVTMAMVNGAYEEVFLLGFLLRGLRGFGLSTALGVSVLVRVLYHLYQGPLGALWVLGFGLAFGLYYARYRQLWPPVFAHILWDIVPFLVAQP